MGWRGTAVLALALAAAVTFAYFDVTSQDAEFSWREMLARERRTPLDQKRKPIVSFDPAAVTAVRIRRGDLDLSARRSPDGWIGTDRPKVLDEFVSSLLDLTEILSLDAAPEELPFHGLAPPQAVVELHSNLQPAVRMLVGERNPPSTGVYVQVAGERRVSLTGAVLLWELDKAITALIESSLAEPVKSDG